MNDVEDAALSDETTERPITPSEMSDILTEVVSGIAFMYSALCHRLDKLGVMSADQFRQDLLTKMDREMLHKALGPHPRGDNRLAIQVIDALTDRLDLGRPPKPIKGWKPTIIDGGKDPA